MSSDPYFTEFTIPTGLRVYYRYADVPWFHTVIGLHVGHRDDPPGKEGTAHLLEHQLSSGTQGLPLMNPTQLERWIGEQRFELNHGSTNNDVTVYAAKAEVQRANELFDFLHRFVFLPRLDVGFEHDRQIVRHERTTRGSVREREARSARDRAVFGSHRLATTEGCPEDVVLNALTPDDVQAMHRRYYHYRNAVMVVGGGLGIVDLKRVLGDIFTQPYDDRAPRPQPPGIFFEPPRPNFYHSHAKKSVESVSVEYVWHLSPLERRNAYGFVVLRNTLSRLLFDRLRVEEELVYSVGVHQGFNIDRVHLVISTKVRPENVDRVRAIIEHTMRNVEGLRANFDDDRKRTVLTILFEDNHIAGQISNATHEINIFGMPLSPQERVGVFESLQERDLDPFVDLLAPERAYVELYEH